MKKTVIVALIAVSIALLAFTGAAMAGTSPHGGYSATTNFCNGCHDVHDSAGDYVLTREPTVTEVCSTCHGVFGVSMPDGGEPGWTSIPPALAGTAATATTSQYGAYTLTGGNRVSGHRLGIQPGDAANANPGDGIPGGSDILRVVGAGSALYNNESVMAYQGTLGLNCASCHTPHSLITGQDNLACENGVLVPGQDGVDDAPSSTYGNPPQLVHQDGCSSHAKHVAADRLLSSKPNHVAQAATTYNEYCAACHDLRNGDIVDHTGNVVIENHPPVCVSCHEAKGAGGVKIDFPHTSPNSSLIIKTGDNLCTRCHAAGTIV
ncbi:MAG: hypothetical protein IBX61_02855 [Thermoleophilia bacterium]|nr:hypothetical protein [Thermoleophilia bacterium]